MICIKRFDHLFDRTEETNDTLEVVCDDKKDDIIEKRQPDLDHR